MLTQEQIEAQNFTFLRRGERSSSNTLDGGRNEYIALGTIRKKLHVIILAQYDEGDYIKITNYFADPKHYREYFFTGTASNEEEFADILGDLDFNIQKLSRRVVK